jgi:hypothetical protein
LSRLFLVIAVLALSSTGLAQESGKPLVAPSFAAAKLESAPVVDGKILDDAAWTGAVPASGFWQVQPNDGQPATQRTEVYIGFTDDALYVGVMAYDDDPAGIIVTDSRRDSSLDDTDAFLFVIDGLLDRQNGYVFGTNAAGVAYDGQVIKEGAGDDFGSGGGAFNLNWDGIWTVSSRITDKGWSAEFRIPFHTLRYGRGDVQDWGINFQRNIRRNNEVAYWAPLERNRNLYRISEAGTLTGVAPPPQRNLQITPYVLGQWRRGGTADATESDSDFGFDAKYSITPSLTLDLTYNTDFAQVEVDEQQLNLDRFNLFFPEKRPFFLGNAGQFSVGNGEEVEMFFSRRIGIAADGTPIPVDGGARLSGKIGETTNVGLLYMSTDDVAGLAPGNDFAVARISQELPNRSSLGAIFVGREGDGSYLVPPELDSNKTYAIDGRWGVGDNLLFEGWIAKTDTPYLNGDDYAYAAKMNYGSSTWSSRLNYTKVAEDFNPEVGFLRRDDYTQAEFYLMRRFRPDDLWGLLEVRPHITFRDAWDLDGFLETGFQHYDVHWEFKNGYRLDTGANYLTDGLVEEFEIVDDVFVQPGTYKGWEAAVVFHTNLSKPLSFNIRTNIGERFGGDRAVINSTIKFRVGETFSTEFSVIYNDFDLPIEGGDFSVTLSRARISYSFTPQMLLQALVQYNDDSQVLATNLRFSMLRTANTGLFIVYNEFDERLPDAAPKGREFIIKYTYLFDVFK